MSHPAGDWYQYPDGPDYDEPEFTGRCPRCFAFVKREPEHTEGGIEVWRECEHYGGLAPHNATEADVAEYEALTARKRELMRERPEGWREEVRANDEKVARTYRVHDSEPVWPCAKCGHVAGSEEMYQ